MDPSGAAGSHQAAFCHAANALTVFYKQSLKEQKTSYVKGYRAALEAVSRWLAKEQQINPGSTRTISVDAFSLFLQQELRAPLADEADRERDVDGGESGERPRAVVLSPADSAADAHDRLPEEPRIAPFGVSSSSSGERALGSPMRTNSGGIHLFPSTAPSTFSTASFAAGNADPSTRIGSPARAVGGSGGAPPVRKRQLGHLFHAPDPLLGVNFLDTNLDSLHLQEQFSKRGRVVPPFPPPA